MYVNGCQINGFFSEHEPTTKRNPFSELFGLGNTPYSTPFHKVVGGREKLNDIVEQKNCVSRRKSLAESLFNLLSDKKRSVHVHVANICFGCIFWKYDINCPLILLNISFAAINQTAFYQRSVPTRFQIKNALAKLIQVSTYKCQKSDTEPGTCITKSSWVL